MGTTAPFVELLAGDGVLGLVQIAEVAVKGADAGADAAGDCGGLAAQ